MNIMKKTFLFVLFVFSTALFFSIHAQDNVSKKDYMLVIHGGCGNFTQKDIPEEVRRDYEAILKESLLAGKRVLEKGGSSLDAVEKCITIMENSPLFNAGKGAVFTSDGRNELDASIMDGSNLNAGAVAAVSTIKNPISAARKVMTESPHVLLAGKGAENFAAEKDVEIVEPSYFKTEKRWKDYKRSKKLKEEFFKKKKGGTVGAVALDKNGNLAAGTSTGGMSNKKYGRIGDSPIIGAGTYAKNSTCAVSGTGWGEFFIRNVIAYDISALMEYKEYTVEKATEYLMNQKLAEHNANGGVIALDKDGNHHIAFNTTGMFRGYIDKNGEIKVFLFKE
jgi:beta-aspartyl-peptidase (threonine type)